MFDSRCCGVFAVFLEASRQVCEVRRNLSARDDSLSRFVLQGVDIGVAQLLRRIKHQTYERSFTPGGGGGGRRRGGLGGRGGVRRAWRMAGVPGAWRVPAQAPSLAACRGGRNLRIWAACRLLRRMVAPGRRNGLAGWGAVALALHHARRTPLDSSLYILLATGAPGAAAVAAGLAAVHPVPHSRDRPRGGFRAPAGDSLPAGPAPGWRWAPLLVSRACQYDCQMTANRVIRTRLTTPTRGVYCATLMNTNTHIRAQDPNRLTASVLGMSPGPRGLGSACAHAYAFEAQGLGPCLTN